jgi:hypothetical protein
MPELVRDYRIEVDREGTWVAVDHIAANRMRRRVHPLSSSVTTTALRVVVTATNGDDRAMVVAVRVFPD